MQVKGGLLRILHWAFPFLPGKGGQSIFIERIALQFSKLGHTTAIVSSEVEPHDLDSLKSRSQNSVEYFQLPSMNLPHHATQYPHSALKNIFNRFDPNVVHIHNLNSSMLVYLRSCINLIQKKPKVILTIHDLQTLKQLKVLEQTHQLKDFFDAIIFPSKYIQETYAHKTGAERPIFRTIYNGVPLLKDQGVKIRSNLQLLFAADLQEHKGGVLLLSAWQKIFQEFPSVKLKIAGDGPVRDFLEQYAQSIRFKEQIEFQGWLTQDQLNQEFENDCVLIIPSISGEAFGLIGAEASMAGIPIIANRIGALTEIVEDGLTGIIVTPGNTIELAAAIRNLLFDTNLRRSMGEAGRKRAVENFELVASSKSYESIYKLVI